VSAVFACACQVGTLDVPIGADFPSINRAKLRRSTRTTAGRRRGLRATKHAGALSFGYLKLRLSTQKSNEVGVGGAVAGPKSMP
jgi:hypothetical protein